VLYNRDAAHEHRDVKWREPLLRAMPEEKRIRTRRANPGLAVETVRQRSLARRAKSIDDTTPVQCDLPLPGSSGYETKPTMV
jgi:hypothetical protein